MRAVPRAALLARSPGDLARHALALRRFGDARRLSAVPGGALAPQGATQLFVRNLPFELSADELRAAFGKVAEVRDVLIPTGGASGLPRGFAFVTMVKVEDHATAQSDMDGTVLLGRQISVTVQQSKAVKPRLPMKPAAPGAWQGASQVERGGAGLHNASLLALPLEDLFSAVEAGDSMSASNYAVCLGRLGGRWNKTNWEVPWSKVGGRAAALVEKCLAHVSTKPQDWGQRQLAQAAYGASRINVPRSGALIRRCAGAAVPLLAEFDQSELADLAFAMAEKTVPDAAAIYVAILAEARKRGKFDAPAPARAAAAEGAVLQGPRHLFSSRDLASLANAFAKTGAADASDLYDAVARRVVSEPESFSAHNLAIVAYSLSQVRYQDGVGAYDAIARAFPNVLEKTNARNITTVVNAFVKAKRPALGLVDVICRLPDASRFNAHEVSMTAWALARMPRESPSIAHTPLFAALAMEAVRRAPEFDRMELANLIWAFAKAGSRSPALFSAMAPHIVNKLPNFISQDLANVAWAYAKAGMLVPELFDALADAAITRLADGKMPDARHVATLAFAFAKLGHSHAKLFEALAREVVARKHDFNAVELANVIWAFERLDDTLTKTDWAQDVFRAVADVITAADLAKLQPGPTAHFIRAFARYPYLEVPRIYDAVALRIADDCSNFAANELADVAWAFAQVPADRDADYAAVFERIAVEFTSMSKAEKCDARGLGLVARAFAKARPPSAGALLDAVAAQIPGRVKRFTPREIAQLTFSFSKLDHHDAPTFYSAVADATASSITEFSAQEMSILAWSLSALKIYAPALFSAIAKEAPSKLQDFAARDLANTLSAFAAFGITGAEFAPAFFRACAPACVEKMPAFSAHDVAVVSRAYATAHIYDAHLFYAIAEQAKMVVNKMSRSELFRMRQVLPWLEAQEPLHPLVALFNTAEVLEHCRKRNVSNVAAASADDTADGRSASADSDGLKTENAYGLDGEDDDDLQLEAPDDDAPDDAPGDDALDNGAPNDEPPAESAPERGHEGTS